MPNTSQNARLDKLLTASEASVERAESNTDLLKVIQEFASYNGPLEFDRTHAWWLFGASLLLIASAVALHWVGKIYSVAQFFHRLEINPYSFGMSAGLLGIVIAVWSLKWMTSKSDRLPSLSKTIARRSSCFHNELTFLKEDSTTTLKKLDEEFGDYRRGDYSRELVESIQGAFTGTLRKLPYTYRQLHFVNQREMLTTVTDEKGNTKTETRVIHDHYDRYSLVIDFPWVSGISIRSDFQTENDYSQPMDTASPDFNKAFRLTGRNEMLCAKFIKPSTVLHLLKLFDLLDSPNLEFSDSGKLCLSFESSDLFAYGAQYSLSSPNYFHAEIAAGIELPRLMSALQWSHELSELHDDNFSSLPPTNRQEK
ncbi:hypothetical protein [Pseudomonas sp. SWRI99]|uniref:hypothetical protein n=1 Tax=Pseudomonas sp. SWRI99 TaxID=2745506 RepID=UPI0016489AC0|nr:hypothetical protein [Pseudomonas sp. SWRI99]MBC3779308.1 hypothetical protein [Pseudomonas sp. SWRI99]